jgi:hypothetical protein
MAKMQELKRMRNGGLMESVDGAKLGPYPTEHVTSLRMKSTSLKWLMRVIAAIFSLLFIAALALRTETVQSAVARKLATGVEEQFGLRLDFESLHIHWWNRQFALAHCSVGLPQEDQPLLEIATIKLGSWQWVDGNWQLGSLQLSGATLDANGLARWNTWNAKKDPTPEKKLLTGALDHLLIEDFIVHFDLDSFPMEGSITRLECQDIRLLSQSQQGTLAEFQGAFSGGAFNSDTLHVAHLSGSWNATATEWHWSAGKIESNLVDIRYQADGLWDNFSFTETHVEASIEQREDLPLWIENALARQHSTQDWGPWLVSQLDQNSLHGSLDLHWEQPAGWLVSLKKWNGLPGIETLDFARWEQTPDGRWLASGKLQGLAHKSFETLRTTPLGLKQDRWLDSLDALVASSDEWGLRWQTQGEAVQVVCQIELDAQTLPLELALNWTPAGANHSINWESHNIPSLIGQQYGYGEAWKASGQLNWSSETVRGQAQLDLSDGGVISTSAAAFRDTLEGQHSTWISSGTAQSLGTPLPLEMTWTGSWTPERWSLESNSVWQGFRPLLLSEREDWELHAQTALRASGQGLNDIQMVFEMRQINLLENGRPMAFNRLDLSGNWKPESSLIAWSSDLTEGQISLENDWERWEDWLDQWKRQKDHHQIIPPNFQARCSIRSFAPIAALAHLPFSLEKGAQLSASSQASGSFIQLDIPRLQWEDYVASGMHIDAEDGAKTIFINAQCDSIHQRGKTWIEDAHVDCSGDSLWWMDASWNAPDFGRSEMQWSANTSTPNIFDLQLTQLSLPFDNQMIDIRIERHKLTLDFAAPGMEIRCDNLQLNAENWTLLTEGNFRSHGESFWSVDAGGALLPKFQSPPFNAFTGSELEATLEWCQLDGVSDYTATLKGESFGYHNLQLEDFDLLVDGDLAHASYWLSAQIESEASLSAHGKVPFQLDDAMHNQLTLESIPLDWLNNWMPEESVEWSGVISGALTLDGTPNKPALEGWIATDSAAVRVDYLGASYQLQGHCDVVPDEFFLDQWEATDSEGHTALINGTVMHDHFNDWNFDVGLEASAPFQLLNLTRADNDWFYGTAYGIGDANVFGYDNNLQIEAQLTTGPGTRFALPLDGASDATYASFIHFTEPQKDRSSSPKEVPDLSRFRVDLNIDVTEDAVARIIFDESVGDEIMGVTRGDLSIGINDFEQISMTGQLEVVEGAYFFTLQNLINKQFDIEPGGSISWFGDPYEAEIDLDTRYKVRTNLDGLLPDESNLPGRIPVHLNLALQGALMQPDIEFSIELPEATPQLKTLVEGALINEEELNRQALSLLVLNQFLSPDPMTAAFGGENMQDRSTAFIASQLGHWISQISPDMDIGFDYANDPSSEDQSLAVALSTRLLDDRLHVEGAIGTSQLSQVSAQNVQLQDMTLSYDLDEKGTFQLTGHTRQNPEWSSPYGATTQGVGLRFHREFNEWWERRKRRDATLNDEL